jgi:U4/U6 small nuclear ribonucleoprotein PRP4
LLLCRPLPRFLPSSLLVPLPYRAQKRVAQQKVDSKLPLSRIIDIRKRVFADVKVWQVCCLSYYHALTIVKTFSNLGSQIGDERPISLVRFAPNGQVLATGSWSGSVKLWNVPACTPIRTLRGEFGHRPVPWLSLIPCLGHSDRVGGVAWHPQATLSQSIDSVNLVSGAGDACINVWSLNRFAYFEASLSSGSQHSRSETPISVLRGHQDRICRVAFHPSGNYIASASFDTTWRFWDINTSKELLLQEGHSREVYTVEFQDDGSLAASAYATSLLVVTRR